MIAIPHRLLIGLAGSLLIALVALQMTVASHVDGRYLPVGHDAFYHASRIMDAVVTGQIAQFDPRTHAPEGDWVAWPWAYDAFIAMIVRAVQAVTGLDPMTVAAHVPPVLGIAGVWLVLATAGLIGLSTGFTTIAVACFALHAFSQYQFGVGALDHHGSEQLAVLGDLVLGLRWLQRPESTPRATLAGLWLGASIGIHASLVVLQLPLLAALLVQWIRREPIELKPAAGASLGLLAGALLMLIPADTFWQQRFELYYLSWLQLYACVASAILIMAVARWPFSTRALIGVAGLTAVLAIPMLAAFQFSAAFVAGDLPAVAQIDEIRSPFAFLRDPMGLRRLNQVYTLLVWLAPVVCLAVLFAALNERDRALRFFWIWAAIGLLALMIQVRLGSLGVVFLYLPLLLLAQRATATRRWDGRRVAGVMALLIVLAYLPTFMFQLGGRRIPAMDQNYSSSRFVLSALAKACATEPGVVLASPGDGHLVRFFTECAVVSNNFRLTQTDQRKIADSLRLIGQPAAVLQAEAPYVKYVLARLIAPAESPDPVLFDELLNPLNGQPRGFRTIVKVGITRPDGSRSNVLGVFAVNGFEGDPRAIQ